MVRTVGKLCGMTTTIFISAHRHLLLNSSLRVSEHQPKGSVENFFGNASTLTLVVSESC